jgi:hypothetical protein
MAVHKADGVDGRINKLIKTITVYTTNAVTAGDSVIINTAASAALKTLYGPQYLVKQSSDVDSPVAAGIALTSSGTIPAGGAVGIQVQVAGKIGTGTASEAGVPHSTAVAILVDTMVGSAASGRIVQLAAPTATAWPFAVCIDAYPAVADSTAGIIMILDKGWYD